ncbi:Salicylate synthase [Paramyrothecium foliicola]|nr:Salicylate synthase [Paramyrothecium foliicola]
MAREFSSLSIKARDSILDQARHLIQDRLKSLDSSLRIRINTALHDNPELAYEEFFATRTIVQYMQEHGFEPTDKNYGLETCFEFTRGTDGRQAVICAEYDALPNMGHACGHNLIATSSVAAFLAASHALEVLKLPGRLRLLGTPAEENSCGKGKLIEAGAFYPCEDIAAAIMAHPISASIVNLPSTYSGIAGFKLIAAHAFKVEFTGRAAHAAGEPWKGINALDAAVTAYNTVAVLRQQIGVDERVHGVIEEGGKAPGVIPDYTRMHWHVRAPTKAQADGLLKKVKTCMESSAAATGCDSDGGLSLPSSPSYENMRANRTLCEIYTQEMAALGENVLREAPPATASTDMGNVSHIVPSFHGGFVIPTTGQTTVHSMGFAVAARQDEAHAAALQTAKGMAMLAVRVLIDDAIALAAWHDFEAADECGGCVGGESPCVFINERPKRGPKKGQLKQLKAQIAALEEKLASQSNTDLPAINEQGKESNPTESFGLSPGNKRNEDSGHHSTRSIPGAAIIQAAHGSDMVSGLGLNPYTAPDPVAWLDDFSIFTGGQLCNDDENTLVPDGAFEVHGYPHCDSSSKLSKDGFVMSEMTKADLDAIYLERVHVFVPMIHKRNFFAWANHDNLPPARACLRFAAWTLSAALSAQFRSLGEKLYAHTKQLLFMMDGDNHDLFWTTGELHLEQIQAWLLIAYYEFVCIDYQQAHVTATRIFKLVQRAHLHMVDVFSESDTSDLLLKKIALPETPVSADPDDTRVLAEEKRRTFWVSYCFDRLINAHDSMFFTLHEELAGLLESVVHLLNSNRHSDYYAYERGSHWHIGLGNRSLLVVHSTGSSATVTSSEGTVTEDIQGQIADVARKFLANHGLLDGKVFGYAGFNYAAHSQGQAFNVGKWPLLTLCVPRVEINLGPDCIVVKGDNDEEVKAVCDALRLHKKPKHFAPPMGVDTVEHADNYIERVEKAISEIAAGQYKKIIASRAVELAESIDMIGTLDLGRRSNSPARTFTINHEGHQATGFSPELVMLYEHGRVVTEPLAGTRSREGTEAEVEKLRKDLLDDPKEVVEHVISVQEAVDELKRVCLEDSVAVEDFMSIRPRGSVQHLGSRVAGKLAPGKDAWDAFNVLFPSITASGIPKPLALEAIQRLEPQPRELYSGAVLLIDGTEFLEAALVLRSAFQDESRRWIQAGAGVILQSSPQREFLETREKLASIAPYVVRRENDQMMNGSNI